MSDLLADTQAARKRRKAITLTLTAATILMAITVLPWWRSLGAEDDAVVGNSAAPIEMSAVEILAAYEDDPTLARLDGRPILISAPLEAPPTAGTAILLSTPDPLLSLGAEMDPRDAVKLHGVQAGTEVSLRCEGVDPAVRAPALRSCVLQ